MINQEGVANYLNWWDKYLYQPHGKRLASSGGGEIKDFLSQDDINYLAKLVPETQPGTMNFFLIMKTIGRAFAAVLPQISDERPDIMQRMMALRSVPKSVALANRSNQGCAIMS
jgi:coproporphyrinogen III oxidase